MKVKIIIWALVLIWFISCSIPSDPNIGDITLENYKINIVFDRETFEFDTLELEIKLDSIAFPDSFKVAPIADSTSQDFNDYIVEGGSGTIGLKRIPYTVAASTNINAFTLEDSLLNFPPNPMFLWAYIGTSDPNDSVEVNFTISNLYKDIAFDQINFVLLRKVTTYPGIPDTVTTQPAPTSRIVIDKTFLNIQPNSTVTDTLRLSKSWITDDMTIYIAANSSGLRPADNINGVEIEDSLRFDFELDSCKFSMAYADFSMQQAYEKDTYGRDSTSTEYNNVTLRSIVLKDAELKVDARNNTDLFVTIDGYLDDFWSFDDVGDSSRLNIEQFSVNPRTNGVIENVIPSINLDGCKLYVDYETQLAKVTHSATATASPDSIGPYVLLTQSDSISFYFEARSTNASQSFVPFYEIDGRIKNETIQISQQTSGFADDLDWDDYNGVTLNSMELKILASFGREDLFMESLNLDGFEMRGVKEDGSTSSWVLLRGYTLTNFNRDTLVIEEDPSSPDTFESIINFRPDIIEYRANATMDFNGKMYYDDHLNLKLIVNTPLEITITDSLVQELEVREMNQLDIGDSSEVLSMKINSFINNPPDELDRNAVIYFEINIADEAVFNADSTEIDSLSGNIIKLVGMKLTANPDKYPNGYMLTDIAVGAYGVDYDDEGIIFSNDAMNMMIRNDTYMQQVLTIKPDPDGPGSIYLSDTGSIEVQTKISCEFNLYIDTDGGDD